MRLIPTLLRIRAFMILPVLSAVLLGCLPDQPVSQIPKRKKAVVCKDSVRIVWDETKLIQTSSLTGNPCYNHGGIAYYVYK